MNSSLKGACLSGLVYPGLGQIVQKHYLRGIALISIVTASLILPILAASREIKAIFGTIESSNADQDISNMLRETATLSAGRDSAAVKAAFALILCCWVIGIVDAYLSGKRIESEKMRPTRAL